MRRALLIAALFLIALTLLPIPIYADTGTYEILNYAVELTPLSDGSVNMTYYQEWLCTGGHIPWVTVGTANSNFDIISYGGNVESARKDSSGGWYGVYLTLDKDYTSGEQFAISFSIIQRNLLERLTDEGRWRIDFTPGWYDNCVTDNLTITLNSPVPVGSYSFTPQPTQVIDNIVTWQTSLARGGKFSVRMESYDGSFLQPAEPTGPSFDWGVLIPIFIVGFLVFIFVRSRRRERPSTSEEYIFDEKGNLDDKLKEAKEKWEKDKKGTMFSDREQARFDEFVAEKKLEPDINGNYYYNGNFINPWILFWALNSLSYRKPIMDVFTTTGAGTRGGSSCIAHSCACVACACACACACAGGGAAGCAKKLDYYDGIGPGEGDRIMENSNPASESGEDNTKAS